MLGFSPQGLSIDSARGKLLSAQGLAQELWRALAWRHTNGVLVKKAGVIRTGVLLKTSGMNCRNGYGCTYSLLTNMDGGDIETLNLSQNLHANNNINDTSQGTTAKKTPLKPTS